MEGKLIIVVALVVTLGYISPVSSLRSPYCGLTNGLAKLEVNRTLSISRRIAAHAPLFDSFDALAAEFVFDLQPAPNSQSDDAAIAGGALISYLEGINYTIGSIPFALKRTCAGLDQTIATVDAIVREGVAAVPPIVALALQGNYPGNRAAFDAYQVNILAIGERWVEEIYKLIRSCANTNNGDTLTAIQTAENGSVAAIRRAVYAFFNAVRSLSIAITYGNKNVTLIAEIEGYRIKLYDSLRDQVNHEFALLEAIYLSSCSKQSPGPVSDLYSLQYGTFVSSNIAGQFGLIAFQEISYQANKIEYGLSDDGEEISSRIVAARAKVYTLINASVNPILEAFVSVYPDTSCKVEDARKNIYHILKQVAGNYFRIINAAGNRNKTYSEAVAKIKIIRDEEIQLLAKFADSITVLIRNNQTWNKLFEKRFVAIKSEIIVEGDTYIDNLVSAAKILAKISRAKGKVHHRDILAISAATGRGQTAIISYVFSVAKALRLSYHAGKGR